MKGSVASILEYSKDSEYLLHFLFIMKYDLNYLVDLDYREERSRKIIEAELKKIKPFKKFEHEIPFEALEKLIGVIQKKYNMFIREIVPDESANEKFMIWRCSIYDLKNLRLIRNVYGISMYELFCKVVLVMFENKDVGIRGSYGRN